MSRVATPASTRSNPLPVIRLAGAAVVVAVGVASAAAAAVAAGVTCVRLVADTNCHIRIVNPTAAATANDTYLPKDRAEMFMVTAGDVISVIRDTADGHLFINAAATT